MIDDDKELTTMLKLILEEKKHEVDIAYNGEDGKKLALKNNYDLIILDVMMPGMNGFELCKKIKNKVKSPVLMMTSLSMVEDRVTGFNSGADDYLIKPFSMNDFYSRINSLTNV